jgi:hypothetical protein
MMAFTAMMYMVVKTPILEWNLGWLHISKHTTTSATADNVENLYFMKI